ncbi:DNA-binding response regulator, partial [Streptomyces calidiresistens]|nr:DNA-binding response regulator [Streptomyces calidiresistens]
MVNGFGPGTAADGPASGGSPAEPIRVLVVDDHELFRRGLEIVLAHEPDIRVVGE